MEHISFPSIEQFRSIIKHVRDNAKHHNVAIPTLNFQGTVKLHGTNHGVCLSPTGEIYTQSRERITTPTSDNEGSSAWTFANIEVFDIIFRRIKSKFLVKQDETIQIFGEWCGGNIQKGVGLNNVPKMFVVFGVRISADAADPLFLPVEFLNPIFEDLLYTSQSFPTFNLEIDFSKPELAQEALADFTKKVEDDCPVARQLVGEAFESELIGEGVVWSCNYGGATLRFKVKGEKHSSSKVKVLAPVDVERVTSIREFVESVVTESRLTQGLEHVESREAKNTGAFIKWVMGDIIKEELDTMVANDFTTKDISGPAATAIRQWFLGAV